MAKLRLQTQHSVLAAVMWHNVIHKEKETFYSLQKPTARILDPHGVRCISSGGKLWCVWGRQCPERVAVLQHGAWQGAVHTVGAATGCRDEIVCLRSQPCCLVGNRTYLGAHWRHHEICGCEAHSWVLSYWRKTAVIFGLLLQTDYLLQGWLLKKLRLMETAYHSMAVPRYFSLQTDFHSVYSLRRQKNEKRHRHFDKEDELQNMRGKKSWN